MTRSDGRIASKVGVCFFASCKLFAFEFLSLQPSTFSIVGTACQYWKPLLVIIFAIIATYTIQLSTFFCFRSFVLV